MVLPPFSVAVHYDMGHELENGLAGRRTRMDSRVAAPPVYSITSLTAITVGLVLFLPNSLKQRSLGGRIPDTTRGRRIHNGRKSPSKPPENLPFSPKILRRGEDATSTVIANPRPQLISRSWKPSRRIRPSRF